MGFKSQLTVVGWVRYFLKGIRGFETELFGKRKTLIIRKALRYASMFPNRKKISWSGESTNAFSQTWPMLSGFFLSSKWVLSLIHWKVSIKIGVSNWHWLWGFAIISCFTAFGTAQYDFWFTMKNYCNWFEIAFPTLNAYTMWLNRSSCLYVIRWGSFIFLILSLVPHNVHYSYVVWAFIFYSINRKARPITRKLTPSFQGTKLSPDS